MARRRSDRTTSTPNDGLLSSFLQPLTWPDLRGLDQARAMVTAIEDRRTWFPDRLRPAASVTRADRRMVISGTVADGKYPGHRFSFAVPKRVAICVRRKQRREVIFAKAKAGKGAARRSRRRNRFSDIGC